MPNLKFAFFCLLLLFATVAPAQLALEYDINQSPEGSDPTNFAKLNGKVFFAANDKTHGEELWRYDPGSNETERITDLIPFGIGSGPSELFAFDGLLFFNASEGSGPRLFIHDPVAEATYRVTAGESIKSPHSFTVYQNELYFIAELGSSFSNLFKFVAADKSVELVLDLDPSITNDGVGNLLAVGEDLYFSGNDQIHGTELWKYNKASGAVQRMTETLPIEAGGGFVYLTLLDNKIYYRGTSDQDVGEELFAYDISSETTSLVADIRPGPLSSKPNQLTAVGDYLAFSAGPDAELWAYHPASETLLELEEINPNDDATPNLYGLYDGQLIFSATSDALGRELYSFDPSDQSISLYNEFLPGAASREFYDGLILGNVFYYSGVDPAYSREFFGYNMATDTDQLLKDINPNTFSSDPDFFVAYADRLYFRADDEVHGEEIWVYDPINGTTELLMDFRPGAVGGNPAHFFVFQDKLFLNISFEEFGQEPAYFDVTTGEVTLLENIRPGNNGSSPNEWTPYDGKLFFVASPEGGVQSLYAWNPENESVENFPASSPRNLHVHEDILYFSAKDDTAGEELMQLDASTELITLVKDINDGGEDSFPDYLTSHLGKLYFRAYDPGNSIQLRSYDPVTDEIEIHILMAGNSDVQNLIVYNNELYLAGSQPSNNLELWRFNADDGSFDLVADINPDGHARPQDLVLFNDKLYFSADHPDYGRELWEFDAATDQVQIVADIWSGPSAGNPSNLTRFNDKLYFAADNGTQGVEIWSLAACLNAFLTTVPDLDQAGNGSIDLTVSGGTPPYNFEWSNGSNEEDLDQLAAGDYLVTITDQSGCISIIEGRVDEVTEVKTLAELDFSLFPNPSNGHIELIMGFTAEADLSLFDSQGRLLLMETIRNRQHQLSLRDWPNGLYVLKLEAEGRSSQRRFALQR